MNVLAIRANISRASGIGFKLG